MDPCEIRSAAGVKQALWFGAAGRPLFGFYHPPAGSSRGVGVVLCRPIGTDLTRSDRASRHLAERLAAAGFACLRFDLYGTGDSGGEETDPRLAQFWLDDVGRAVEEIRARSGVERVALVGLRLGATLAMAAAADRGDVDSLVLWSPWISGGAFVAEATKLHKLYLRIEPEVATAPAAPIDGEEALGMLLARPVVADLSRLDLIQVSRRPARRALLIDGGNVAGRDALLEHLRGLGAETEMRSHPGHKFLITISHRAALPDEIIDSVAGWLKDAYPATAPAAPVAPRPSLPAPAGERALRFGADRPLFGILTPADPALARPGRPPIVITNAGAVSRVGPHRLYVKLARRWAALGFDVLRIDLSGIGDSPVAPDARENLTYPPSGLDDIREALRVFGRPAVVAGLCSGGDYAFQLGGRAENLAGVFILNPRTFCVLDLAAVESGDSAPPAAPVDEVPRMLRRSAESGVRTVLMVGRKDPGVAYVDAHAGEAMRALSAVPGFERIDLTGTDHTFTPVSVQERVSELLSRELQQRF